MVIKQQVPTKQFKSSRHCKQAPPGHGSDWMPSYCLLACLPSCTLAWVLSLEIPRLSSLTWALSGAFSWSLAWGLSWALFCPRTPLGPLESFFKALLHKVHTRTDGRMDTQMEIWYHLFLGSCWSQKSVRFNIIITSREHTSITFSRGGKGQPNDNSW